MGKLEQDLFNAIDNKDNERVISCLKQGARVNVKNKEGKTPLIIAITQNEKTIVQTLLNSPDIDPSSNDGPPNYKTSLEYAINLDKNGNYSEMIDYLFSHESLSEQDLNLALLYYAKSGNLEKVCECLDTRGCDINFNHRHYGTPLHCAIENKQLAIVQKLLSDNTINVNSVNYLNETPLILAIKLSHTDFAKLLLTRNDLALHIQSYLLGTALVAAIYFKHYDLAKSLLEKEVKFEDRLHPGALLVAIRNGALDMVKLLVEKGANIKSIGKEGYEEPPSEVWKEKQASPFFRFSGKKIFELPLTVAEQENQTEIQTYLLNIANQLSINSNGKQPSQNTFFQKPSPEFDMKNLNQYLEWLVHQSSIVKSQGFEALNKVFSQFGCHIEINDQYIQNSSETEFNYNQQKIK